MEKCMEGGLFQALWKSVASVNVWKSNETCHYLMPHFWTRFKSWDLMVSAYLVLMDLVAPIVLNEPCKGLTCLKYCSVAICIVINFQICTRFICMVVVQEIVKAHFKLLWILDAHEKSLYSGTEIARNIQIIWLQMWLLTLPWLDPPGEKKAFVPLRPGCKPTKSNPQGIRTLY